MPVCLNDGEVYIIDNKINIDRRWIISFFLNGHIEDYLLVYDQCGQYSGVITYKSFLQSTDMETAIIYDKLKINEFFWQDARALLCDSNTVNAVPVFNRNMELLYFAKYDKALEDKWNKMLKLYQYVDKVMLENFQCFAECVHIKGINDVLFKLREWLALLGVKVSVEGEEWEAFGIETRVYAEKGATVIDKECRWIDSAYDEYCRWLEVQAAETLGKMLCKPYEPEAENKEKIIFYLSIYMNMVENVSPLIYYYARMDKECICVFPSVEEMVSEGGKNIVNMNKTIQKLVAAGVKCHTINEKGILCNQYAICFFLSEYSKTPMNLRKLSRHVVALQTTALYTHMYLQKGLFERVFSEQAKQEMDYLIASDYMADWICERDKTWDNKILRLGYPKLDALYSALKCEDNIPKSWLEKTSGKKVYLFITYSMAIEQLWLDYFPKEGNRIAIWRPHPLNREGAIKTIFKEISDKCNVIVDTLPEYYAAFQVSDAFIGDLQNSVIVNYLYTGKPVCLYSRDEVYESAVIDYRKECWYKCSDVASKKEDIFEFISKVEGGGDIISREQMQYRKFVTSNFDGRVCSRIYEYFEK